MVDDDPDAAELVAALAERFGEHDWEIRPNNYPSALHDSHGYYAYWGPGGPSIGDVREVIDALFMFRFGVILHQREERR